MRKPIHYLFPLLLILPLLFGQTKIAWTAAEKPIYDSIRSLRGLTDEQRPATTTQIARQIRSLPVTPGKQALAIQLSHLVTEGDPGHQTLQETAVTLANSLREQPSTSEDPYLTLAQLVRYEHVEAPLSDPRFQAALKVLDADDEQRNRLDFTLTALDGTSWTLKQLVGKVVVVNFWATWCPPCRKEMPDLDALYKQFSSKGLVILAISDEERPVVDKYLAEHPVSYPILLDRGGKVAERFIVRGIPKTFVYNRTGKLAAESMDMRTRGQFLEMLKRAGLQ